MGVNKNSHSKNNKNSKYSKLQQVTPRTASTASYSKLQQEQQVQKVQQVTARELKPRYTEKENSSNPALQAWGSLRHCSLLGKVTIRFNGKAVAKVPGEVIIRPRGAGIAMVLEKVTTGFSREDVTRFRGEDGAK